MARAHARGPSPAYAAGPCFAAGRASLPARDHKQFALNGARRTVLELACRHACDRVLSVCVCVPRAACSLRLCACFVPRTQAIAAAIAAVFTSAGASPLAPSPQPPSHHRRGHCPAARSALGRVAAASGAFGLSAPPRSLRSAARSLGALGALGSGAHGGGGSRGEGEGSSAARSMRQRRLRALAAGAAYVGGGA